MIHANDIVEVLQVKESITLAFQTESSQSCHRQRMDDAIDMHAKPKTSFDSNNSNSTSRSKPKGSSVFSSVTFEFDAFSPQSRHPTSRSS